MTKVRIVALLLFTCYLENGISLSLSIEDAHKIGERIWKNECEGSVEGLTSWNRGEGFASLGIGHFIWYSHNRREKFQETFPDLLLFLQENGANLLDWLQAVKECPWNSREEFYEGFQSPKMKSLRQFLFETRGLQAIFMASRLETSLAQLLNECPEQDKVKVSTLFNRMVKDPSGLYALIDYLNFKGAGISPKETYQGQGWGLLQVLRGVPDFSEMPVADFVRSAKVILNQRVKNAPPERNEAQWLKGWFNRLDTYLN